MLLRQICPRLQPNSVLPRKKVPQNLQSTKNVGNTSLKFQKQIKASESTCFRAVEFQVMLFTKFVLPAVHTGTVLSLQRSNSAYEYVGRCNFRYVGRTTKRISDRINQKHVHISIRLGKKKEKQAPIGKYSIFLHRR